MQTKIGSMFCLLCRGNTFLAVIMSYNFFYSVSKSVRVNSSEKKNYNLSAYRHLKSMSFRNKNRPQSAIKQILADSVILNVTIGTIATIHTLER